MVCRNMWSTYPFGNKVVVRATRELLDGTYGVVVHKGDLGIVRLTGDGYPVVDFRGQSVPCGPEEIEYVGYDTIDTGTDEPYDPAELPIKVLHSPAGYYIGQLEPGGAPYSRLSDCYYKKREDAEKALAAGWPSGREENEELERRLEDKRVLKVRHPEEAASSRSSGGGTLPDDWEETGKQMIRDDIDLEFIKKHTVPGERNGDVAADRRLQRRLQLLQDALDCLLRILCQLPITCPGMLAPIRHMGTCFRCQVLHRARKMGLLRNDAPDEARSRG